MLISDFIMSLRHNFQIIFVQKVNKIYTFQVSEYESNLKLHLIDAE